MEVSRSLVTISFGQEGARGAHEFLGPSLFRILAAVLVIEENLELMKELDW